MAEQPDNNSLVISYLTLRKTIGFLGVSLPFILYFGAWIFFSADLQPSVSKYYYTGMGDVFVGMLCVIGFFLFSYKGYDWRDDLAGDLAWVFALGVALFPTSTDSVDQGIIGYIHLGSALLFFCSLIYFSLFLFTKTDPSHPPTHKKLQRNKIYKACGYGMGGCIFLLVVYFSLPETTTRPIAAYKPVFWLEGVAVVAFGISWLTKGEALLGDEV